MSLLMKALEKAAKDHEGTDTANASARDMTKPANGGGEPAGGGLTLEPMAEPGMAAPPVSAATSHSPRRSAPYARANTNAGPAQAATVLRAGQNERSGALAYLSEHPLVLFGALGALFLIAYGGYVYMQLNNPGMFARQPAKSVASAPITPAPSNTTASSSSASTAAPSAAQNELTPLLPPMSPSAEKNKPSPVPAISAIPAPPASAALANPTVNPATAAPAAAAPAAVAAPSVPAPVAPRDTIKIVGGSATPSIHPLLNEAYTALNSGNLDQAQRLYQSMLRTDANNVDALLGLAAIAAQQSDAGQAAKHYMRILEIEPRNALAQAGLIGMLGRADPLAAETRLKQLIASEPSAYLYFTLGNLYADLNRWPDAQLAYFQAHHLQPGNPDYAFNLAVGLEHIGQARLALNFYRNALQLAAAGRANFNTSDVKQRIVKLEKLAP